MNHAQLRAFHAVATLGGFSAASRKVGITQPALTVQVRALERDFGVQLFHRTGRSVQLTQTGEALQDLTKRYFAIETEAEEYLQSAGALQTGQIRIAADGPYHVIPLLSIFRTELPQMDINVSLGNSDDVLHALTTYDAHLGVSSSTEFDEQFEVLSRSPQPIVLLVPRSHEWATQRSVSINKLQNAPMIMREAGSSTRAIFERRLHESGISPKIVLELGSREAIREAVAAGLGLGVVQESEFGDDSRLAAIHFSGNSPAAEECLICLRERMQTPLMRKLITCVPQSR